MKFGEILRVLIAERDITQKELAQQLNIAPSTMGSYVQGAREPDFETLRQIAKYFGVTTDYLLDYHSDKTSSYQEAELLRIFRALAPEQRGICIEQCRVFVKQNNKEKNAIVKSS